MTRNKSKSKHNSRKRPGRSRRKQNNRTEKSSTPVRTLTTTWPLATNGTKIDLARHVPKEIEGHILSYLHPNDRSNYFNYLYYSDAPGVLTKRLISNMNYNNFYKNNVSYTDKLGRYQGKFISKLNNSGHGKANTNIYNNYRNGLQHGISNYNAYYNDPIHGKKNLYNGFVNYNNGLVEGIGLNQKYRNNLLYYNYPEDKIEYSLISPNNISVHNKSYLTHKDITKAGYTRPNPFQLTRSKLKRKNRYRRPHPYELIESRRKLKKTMRSTKA